MSNNIINKYKNLFINIENEIGEKSRCPHCNHIHILSCNLYNIIWENLCKEKDKILLFKFYTTGYSSKTPEYITSQELKEIEILFGKISGFPNCCIKSYVEGREGKHMSKRINSNYVLCEECEKLYERKQIQ